MPDDEPISKELLLSLGIRFSGQVYKYWICQWQYGKQTVRRYGNHKFVDPWWTAPWQTKFALAVAAGQSLDADQKLYWGKIGVRKKEPLPWWNAFISAYMKDLVDPVTQRHVRNLQVR